MDFTVKISLSIYGIASLNFFFLFIHLFFFAFLALKNSAVLAGGWSYRKKEQTLEELGTRVGDEEKLFFFAFVIRVFGGWVNVISLKNYFGGR